MSDRVALALCVIALPIVIYFVPSGPGNGMQTVTRRTVTGTITETLDEDGERHGYWSAVDSGGTLRREGESDHGVILWYKVYDREGRLRAHQFEGADYRLQTIKYDEFGRRVK